MDDRCRSKRMFDTYQRLVARHGMLHIGQQ
jgi:hypothetical protein